MQYINLVFTGMFSIETILKIIGFRFRVSDLTKVLTVVRPVT